MQYYWARDFDRATEQIVRTLELERDSPPALYLLGWIHTFRGQHDDAIDAVERALDAGGRISPYLAGLGCALAAAGRADDARAVLAEMETARGRQYVSPRDLALVHACLGEDDEAIHYLERAYEEHAPWMSFLAVDPMWDRLRDDPRFTAIVRKMGLAPPQTAAAGASATSSPR
jgi:tetratricopeptide (TPR) repeat protein